MGLCIAAVYEHQEPRNSGLIKYSYSNYILCSPLSKRQSNNNNKMWKDLQEIYESKEQLLWSTRLMLFIIKLEGKLRSSVKWNLFMGYHFPPTTTRTTPNIYEAVLMGNTSQEDATRMLRRDFCGQDTIHPGSRGFIKTFQ